MARVLAMDGINKRYSNVVALNGAAMELSDGEVHVLLGANGSGKSTLSKIVNGSVRPDSGRIELSGEVFTPGGPQDARRAGIAVVYQELSLIPTLTVAQNITLGALRTHPGRRVPRTAVDDGVKRWLDLFGGVVDQTRFRPDVVLGDLPVDEQQLVEILKALYRDPRILILDEATASLHGNQVQRLFEIVRDRTSSGCAVVFITHRMEEIYQIGDRATVLRNGTTVGTYTIAETSRDQLLTAMVGETMAEHQAKAHHFSPDTPVTLRVNELVAGRIRGISFNLRRGEVLGLSGLQGQGQSELLTALFGAVSDVTGSVTIKDETATIRHPAEAIRHGLAYVTGDRKRLGVFPTRSILENLTVAGLLQRRSALFSRNSLRQWVQSVVTTLQIVMSGLSARIVELSGGNQQKVIIGRWLLTEPKVLLMDDPTKGVDIKTKTELYQLVREMCSRGVSVIWNSSEDIELLEAADRVLVIKDGLVASELTGERLNTYELYKAAL